MKEIVINREVCIPKKQLEFWEKMLSSENIDYDEQKWGQYETVFLENIKFEDGYEIDLKVNTNSREDGDLFSEAVLFDSDGGQVSCTDPEYELKGEWNLYRTDENGNEIRYHLNVVGK